MIHSSFLDANVPKECHLEMIFKYAVQFSRIPVRLIEVTALHRSMTSNESNVI